MEPISTRELVAWVLVLALLVILVTLKLQTPKNSEKSPAEAAKKAPRLKKLKLRGPSLQNKHFPYLQTPSLKEVRSRLSRNTEDPQGFLKDEPVKKDLWDKEKPVKTSTVKVSNAKPVAQEKRQAGNAVGPVQRKVSGKRARRERITALPVAKRVRSKSSKA